MRNDRYLRWLAKKVDIDMSTNTESSYVMLMSALLEKEFYSVVDMDVNRISDGLSLRDEYFDYIDQNELCSVLEVMIALAIRCEADFLGGISTAGEIFWDMLLNLGLDVFTDDKFDGDKVDFILDRFLDREYDPDGAGGLFFWHKSGTKSGTVDMRAEELWWQMQLYTMRIHEENGLY